MNFLVDAQLPRRLLLVAAGNIGNNELEHLVAGNLQHIVDALSASGYVEFGRDNLVCHE